MHHLSLLSRRKGPVKDRSEGCQDQVRFFALLRIKPHAPPLVRVPVNSFEFHSCERTPQVEYLLRLRLEKITAYVVNKDMKEFELETGRLTEDERQIILDGCLINYYKNH